jgi:hypothetical protein
LRIYSSYGPDVCAYARQLCKLFFEKKQIESQAKPLQDAQKGDTHLDNIESLGARLAHLAVEDDVKELMENIAHAKSPHRTGQSTETGRLVWRERMLTMSCIKPLFDLHRLNLGNSNNCLTTLQQKS